MQKSIRVKPRFWIILMLLFLIVFTPLFIILDSHSERLSQTQAEYAKIQSELYARESELKQRIDYVRTAQGIEEFARSYGMVMDGEIQYIAGGD